VVPDYYLDKSVLGGYFDAEFEEDTKRFWQDLVARNCRIVISTLTIEELAHAPVPVQELLLDVPDGFVQVLTITREMEDLADRYVSAGVVSQRLRGDALHVAAATVCGVKAILSWNFKHLVNLRRIERFNGVNMLTGYRTIDIRTPKEVIDL
jgi:predicted nucleic acid-binding protein